MGYFLMTQILREEKHTSVTLEDYIKFFMCFFSLTNNSTPQLWNVSFHSFFYINKSSQNNSFSTILYDGLDQIYI